MKSAFLDDSPVASPATASDIRGATSSPPVVFCAALGVFWTAFVGYVFGSWVLSDHFTPTPPGPDPIADWSLWCIRLFEAWLSMVALWLIWECILKPLRRDGEPSADGLLCTAWITVWMHDIFLNWTVHVFTYNAHAVNFGNWTQQVPGWVSPRSNLVPEPLLAMGLSYFGLCTLAAWTCIRAMEKTKARWPHVSNLRLVLIGLGVGMFLDWAGEHTMISFGLMAYLSTVPSLTLFAGELYQFPLYEAFFFGGVIGFTGVLFYFKDDRGYTWAERGIDSLKIARVKPLKTLVRWLALVGVFQTVAMFGYTMPMQLFCINGAAYPDNVPSYFMNGICGPGTPAACASPEVPMPRPDSFAVPPAEEFRIRVEPTTP